MTEAQENELAGMDKPALRVWWIPQVPMEEPFYVPVGSPEEAIKIIETLANYDLFQLKHNIKPDYCNIGGLDVFEDGEWVEWFDEDGNDIASYEPKTEDA